MVKIDRTQESERGTVIEWGGKGRIRTAYVDGPFRDDLKKLNEEGYVIPSLEDGALFRMQEWRGYDNLRSNFPYLDGHFVREGLVCLPNREVYLVKDFSDQISADELPCKGVDIVVSEERAQHMLRNSVRVTSGNISPNEFGSHPITKFAFGESAEEYGNFIKTHVGWEQISVHLPAWDELNSPLCRHAWFYWIDRSDPIVNKGFYHRTRLVGIKEEENPTLEED
jgi:hypothetical protein